MPQATFGLMTACASCEGAGPDRKLHIGAADLQAALEGFTPAAYWGVGKLSGADSAAQAGSSRLFVAL